MSNLNYYEDFYFFYKKSRTITVDCATLLMINIFSIEISRVYHCERRRNPLIYNELPVMNFRVTFAMTVKKNWWTIFHKISKHISEHIPKILLHLLFFVLRGIPKRKSVHGPIKIYPIIRMRNYW